METQSIGATSLTQEQKDLWLSALRSGEYKQGRNKLCSTDQEFCCLGVLCDVLKVPHSEYDEYSKKYIFEDGIRINYIPSSIIPMTIQSVLSEMNDLGKDFPTIADFIEQNVTVAP